MPIAIARYDVLLRHGSGADAIVVPVMVDMQESRDMGCNGKPGRLRWAKMQRYDAPPGYYVCYMRLSLRNGRPWTWCLTLNDVPQQDVEWDRRWLRWVEDADVGEGA